MSDPNVEPNLGGPELAQPASELDGGAQTVPPSGAGAGEAQGDDLDVDIAEAAGPDLEAGDDLDLGAATP